MVKQYWVAHNGVTLGPYTEDLIRESYRAKQVEPGDMLCLVGDDRWTAAEVVLGVQEGAVASGDYWVAHGGRPQGPFDLDRIRHLYESGRIGPETQTCRVGGAEWVPLMVLIPSVPVETFAGEIVREPFMIAPPQVAAFAPEPPPIMESASAADGFQLNPAAVKAAIKLGRGLLDSGEGEGEASEVADVASDTEAECVADSDAGGIGDAAGDVGGIPEVGGDMGGLADAGGDGGGVAEVAGDAADGAGDGIASILSWFTD